MKTYNKVVNKKKVLFMTNKFSDFMNTDASKKKNEFEEKYNKQNQQCSSSQNTNMNENDKKNVEDMINHYNQYSKEDLMKEILKVSNEEKQKGNVDSNYFENIANTLSPYLTDEQKENMKDIINKIR